MDSENNSQNGESSIAQDKNKSEEKVNKVASAFVLEMLDMTSYDIEAFKSDYPLTNQFYVNIKPELFDTCLFAVFIKYFTSTEDHKLISITEQRIEVDSENIEKCIKGLLSTKIIRVTKDLILLKCKEINNTILQVSGSNQDIINLLIKLDYEYVKTNFENICMDKNNLSKFFFFFKTSENKNYDTYCTNKENFEAFIKVIDYDDLFKIINKANLSYYESIYNKIKSKSMKYRFSVYENIPSDCKLKKEAGLMLKRLTESTFNIIFEQYRSVVLQDPIMAIDLIINEAIKFEAMIPIYKKIINSCHTFFLEVFYYRAIYRLVSFTDVVDKYSYTKIYLNFVKFIEVFFHLDTQPIRLFITKNLQNKQYIHLPLLEKYIGYEKSCKINMNILKKSYIDFFKYTKYSIQFKIDMSDRYYNICVDLGIDELIKTGAITYSNIRYLLPSQIMKIKNDINFKLIIEDFLTSKDKDFYTIKNIIILINNNDNINNASLISKMDEIGQSDRGDLKVLSQCCKAKLISRKRDSEKIAEPVLKKTKISEIKIKEQVITPIITHSKQKHILPSSNDNKNNVAAYYDKRQTIQKLDDCNVDLRKSVKTRQMPEDASKEQEKFRKAKYAKLNEHLKKE